MAADVLPLGRLPRPVHWNNAGDSIGDWRSARNDRIALGVIATTIIGVAVLHPARVNSLLLIPAVGAVGYAGMVVYQRHWSVLRFARTRRGTVVRSDPSDQVFTAVLSFVVALGFAVYAGLVAVRVPLPDLVVAGKRSSTTIHSDENPSHILIIVAVLLAVGVGALMYSRLYKAREYLVLSPDGVAVMAFPRALRIRWEDVTDVTDSAAPATDSAIVLITREDGPFVIDAARYAPKSTALYWMIRHYWSTPGERDELADGVALGRLLREEFPVR